MKEKILKYLAGVTEEGLFENPAPAHPHFTRDSFESTLNPLATKSNLRFIGRLPSVKSTDVKDSIMSIGFETMDRDTFDPAKVIPLLGKTGVKYARCQTGWIKCEPERGVYDFKWLDDIADGLLENGIEPWFSLSFGHPIYTPSETYRKAWAEHEKKEDIPGWARGYVGEVPMYYGEDAMQAFINYCRETAKHFKGRVHVYEVWNEPEWFWMNNGENMRAKLGMPQATRDYVEMVRRVSEVVREIDPTARIASVTANYASGYIQDLGKAGLGNYIDIHCFHYYGPELEAPLHDAVDHIRACLEVPGRKLDIWQGESGRPSGHSMYPTIPTEYNQAKFLVRRLFSDAAEGLPVSSIFTASDFKKYYADGCDQQYGLVTVRDVKPKKSFFSFQGCGFMLDGLKRDRSMFAALETISTQTQTTETLPFHAKVACFRKEGLPVFAVWQPAHVDLPHPVQIGEFCLLHESDDKMENPIVIDPLRRNVYLVEEEYITRTDDPRTYRTRISDFPVGDYPLLVTDLSIFEKYVK